VRATVNAGDGTLVPGPRRFVAVRRVVSLSVTAPLYQEIAGVPFPVRGTLRPGVAGENVVVEGSHGGRFAPLATVRLRRGGVFAGTVRVTSGGRWRFRVRAAATPAGQGPAATVTSPIEVFSSNPHHVPATSSHYIVQERSQTRIYYYEGGKLLRVFPVVFGKPSTPTPVGRFAVYSKTTGPNPAFGPLVLWYHRGYGIHGTNQEYLLARSWRYYSHGCTRNYNANIRWLWPRVPVGTPVLNLA
jgi:L,D-transpeptidase ErfK/SrfK